MVADISALIPSQVYNTARFRSKQKVHRPSSTSPSPHQNGFVSYHSISPNWSSSLIPSQVCVSSVKFRQNHPRILSSTKLDETNNDSIQNRTKKIPQNYQQQQQQRKTKNGRSKNTGSGNKGRNTTNSKSTDYFWSNKQKRSRTGNIPDVFWRNIPVEHIRQHPYFIPLPRPETIRHLNSKEDVRNFRQESWQWDVLHDGRCTTSQAVAALGFLEPLAAEFLGVPKGLRRGGRGAYHRLQKPLKLTSLQEMNSMLCVGSSENYDEFDENVNNNDNGSDNGNDDDDDYDNGNDNDNDNDNIYWTKQPSNFPFAAKYMIPITQEEHKNRRHQMIQYIESSPDGIRFSIRMIWGNIQESTSLLTALNWFWKRDNQVIMKEIGMCGAGLALNNTLASTSSSGLMLGATPDAILCHPNGRIEAVEVKNHCPFVPNNDKSNHRFRLSRQELISNNNNKGGGGGVGVGATVMVQNIPQLMMEMLCIGEECKSAIMVRQTAINGSLILRLHRNDEWIEEMLYWLNRFMSDYVQQGIPPPPNFFLKGSAASAEDQNRYKEFLNLTKQIEKNNVELLAHVPNHGIQRATGGKFPKSMDLFFE
eukprot:CAMPEP_0170893404 /NCGR_PEP_ID=MMETSP0734-20130129/42419_1 /TAXON_ID=186038 /ORGANISM="Fragilariopsis kerguelensis, Strain L26-C5" /LENGTH=591 /DNA_ID=CAMNT_0011283929 /DNA_START=25 /DNA_END=1800 /DNA_ORIENTATION=+